MNRLARFAVLLAFACAVFCAVAHGFAASALPDEKDLTDYAPSEASFTVLADPAAFASRTILTPVFRASSAFADVSLYEPDDVKKAYPLTLCVRLSDATDIASIDEVGVYAILPAGEKAVCRTTDASKLDALSVNRRYYPSFYGLPAQDAEIIVKPFVRRGRTLLIGKTYVFTAHAEKTDSAPGAFGAAFLNVAPEKAIRLVSEPRAVDLVPEKIRAYLNAMLANKTVDYTDGSFEDLGVKPCAPYVFHWSYEGFSPDDATLRCSLREDMTEAFTVKATGTDASVDLLHTGARYYWQVEAEDGGKTVRSDVGVLDILPGPRMFSVGGSYNCRDLGGWETLDGERIKEGLVYRTATLNGLTDDGKKRLLDDLGVVTELDLRSDGDSYNEVPGTGPLGAGVRYVCVAGHGGEWSLNTSATRDALRVFADPNSYPIVFHCAGGADRTGALAILLELLCGCGEPVVIADYELTSGRSRTHTEYGSPKALLDAIKASPGATLREKTAFTLSKLGLTAMELSNIYNILMNDSAVFASDSLKKAKTVKSGRAFTLDLRDSGGVSAVTVDGTDVDWSLNGDTLTVASSAGHGTVVFLDGGKLDFE